MRGKGKTNCLKRKYKESISPTRIKKENGVFERGDDHSSHYMYILHKDDHLPKSYGKLDIIELSQDPRSTNMVYEEADARMRERNQGTRNQYG